MGSVRKRNVMEVVMECKNMKVVMQKRNFTVMVMVLCVFCNVWKVSATAVKYTYDCKYCSTNVNAYYDPAGWKNLQWSQQEQKYNGDCNNCANEKYNKQNNLERIKKAEDVQIVTKLMQNKYNVPECKKEILEAGEEKLIDFTLDDISLAEDIKKMEITIQKVKNEPLIRKCKNLKKIIEEFSARLVILIQKAKNLTDIQQYLDLIYREFQDELEVSKESMKNIETSAEKKIAELLSEITNLNYLHKKYDNKFLRITSELENAIIESFRYKDKEDARKLMEKYNEEFLKNPENLDKVIKDWNSFDNSLKNKISDTTMKSIRESVEEGITNLMVQEIDQATDEVNVIELRTRYKFENSNVEPDKTAEDKIYNFMANKILNGKEIEKVEKISEETKEFYEKYYDHLNEGNKEIRNGHIVSLQKQTVFQISEIMKTKMENEETRKGVEKISYLLDELYKNEPSHYEHVNKDTRAIYEENIRLYVAQKVKKIKEENNQKCVKNVSKIVNLVIILGGFLNSYYWMTLNFYVAKLDNIYGESANFIKTEIESWSLFIGGMIAFFAADLLINWFYLKEILNWKDGLDYMIPGLFLIFSNLVFFVLTIPQATHFYPEVFYLLIVYLLTHWLNWTLINAHHINSNVLPGKNATQFLEFWKYNFKALKTDAIEERKLWKKEVFSNCQKKGQVQVPKSNCNDVLKNFKLRITQLKNLWKVSYLGKLWSSYSLFIILFGFFYPPIWLSTISDESASGEMNETVYRYQSFVGMIVWFVLHYISLIFSKYDSLRKIIKILNLENFGSFSENFKSIDFLVKFQFGFMILFNVSQIIQSYTDIQAWTSIVFFWILWIVLTLQNFHENTISNIGKIFKNLIVKISSKLFTRKTLTIFAILFRYFFWILVLCVPVYDTLKIKDLIIGEGEEISQSSVQNMTTYSKAIQLSLTILTAMSVVMYKKFKNPILKEFGGKIIWGIILNVIFFFIRHFLPTDVLNFTNWWFQGVLVYIGFYYSTWFYYDLIGRLILKIDFKKFFPRRNQNSESELEKTLLIQNKIN